MKITNTFIIGLWSALSLVITDFLNAFLVHPDQPFSWQMLGIAAGVCVVGYIGKFLTGYANTTIAMIGGSLVAIVPLLSTGKINWTIVGITFLIKIMGLGTQGTAVASVRPDKPKE